MPRNPAVTQEDLIQAIEENIEHFITNDFPPRSHPVYTKIWKKLGKKWELGTVYNRVRDDRNGGLTAARRNKNISAPPPKQADLISADEICDEVFVKDTTTFDERDWHDSNDVNELMKQDLFDFLLESHDWNDIKPDGTSPVPNRTLKSEKWPAVFAHAFWRKYRLPCAFLAKSSNVRLHLEDGEDSYFVKLSMYCKDTKHCMNKMTAFAYKPPDEHGLRFDVHTRDTRKEYHCEVQRPLRGVERKKVGRALQGTCASNFQEKLIGQNMEFGERAAYFIRNKHIYNQVKMEAHKEEMGLGCKEKVDMIESIRRLNEDPRYLNCIRSLEVIDFAVWYCLAEQIHVFKEYCRVQKGTSQIAIDASGKFVRKFDLSQKKRTGHIFIFTITINFEHTTLCVNQMLTTIHTQEFIEYWIKYWVQRLGAPSPNECISDYERAIPLSAALAFNNMSLKNYVDECFLWGCLDAEKKITKPRPAPTLILIDVAHVMSFVAKWKCVKDCHPFVKSFIMKCVALLIDAQSIDEFGRIFLFICIVALQPFEETFIQTSQVNVTVREARNKLEDLISTRCSAIENLEASRTLFEENTDKDPDKDFTEAEDGTLTHQWIKRIISKAKPADSNLMNGKSVNAFYLPSFITQLERIAKEFPLWSAAAIPDRGGHASTAYQEGYFARMRSQVFENITLPCQANTFVKTHMDHLLSGSKMMSNNLTHFLHRDKLPHSTPNEAQDPSILEKDVRHPDTPIEQKPPPSAPSTVFKAQNLEKEKAELKRKHVKPEPSNPRNPPEMSNNSIFNDTEFLAEKLPERVYFADDSDLKSFEPWGGLKNPNVFMDVTSSEGEDDRMSPHRTHHCTEQFDFDSDTGASRSLPVPQEDDGDNKHVGNQSFEASPKENSSSVDDGNKPPKLHHVDPPFDLGSPGFNSTVLSDHSYCKVSCQRSRERDSKSPKTEIYEEKNEKNCIEIQGEDKETVLRKLQPKITIRKRIVSKGCHFQPYPEIKTLNSRGVSNKKGFFMKNGNLLPPVVAGNIKIKVKNTCGFDSILHILQFATLDNTKYLSFVEASTHPTLQFLNEFKKHGASSKLYSERLRILRHFYPIEKEANSTSLSPFQLSGYDFITKIWRELFDTEPSAFREKRCSNSHCPLQTKAIPYLVINEKKIMQRGYGVLQEAVQFRHIVRDIQCTMDNCHGLVVERTTCNKHIFIDVDIRKKLVIKGKPKVEEIPLKAVLESFPKEIFLDRKFRLAGVITFRSSHFIPYCLRTTGTWLKCDDYEPKIEPVKDSKLLQELIPHGLIYIED